MGPRFPAKDEAGNFAIAARFHSSRTSRLNLINTVLQSIQHLEDEGTPAFINEFRAEPIEERRDDETIDLLFQGRAGSKVWKDWLVAIIQDVEAQESGLRFIAVIDRVSGRAHPSWPTRR